MGEDSFPARRLLQLRGHGGERLRVVPSEPGAGHSAVDLDMERPPGSSEPGGQGLGVADGGPEIVGEVPLDVADKERAHYQDRAADPSRAKHRSLVHRGDAISPWVERLERTRHRDGAQAVAVSFDHR